MSYFTDKELSCKCCDENNFNAGTLERLNALPNVVVRYSSDGVNGETIDGAEFQSTIISDKTKLNSSLKICRAYENGGKCAKCRACWSKENKIIAYIGHGASMRKEQLKVI